MKNTNTGQDVQIGSLYVDSNSVTWLSFFHQSDSDYSELIKYDMTTDTFTTYQQTGAKYFYQYVNGSNNDYWYGVVSSLKTTGALVENMGLVSLITVSTSTTIGLTNSSFSITYLFPTNVIFNSQQWSTATSNPESDLAYEVWEV